MLIALLCVSLAYSVSNTLRRVGQPLGHKSTAPMAQHLLCLDWIYLSRCCRWRTYDAS